MEDLKLGTGKLLFFFLIFAILCPMASLAAGTTSDWIGRRYTLLFSLVAFFFGSLFTNLAPNAAVFFSSWVLVTIAVGCARTVIPVYITELSPESTQGFLTCFVNVFENTGSFTRESFGLRLVTTHCSATELETRFNRNDPFVSFGSGCSFLLARVTELARVSWKTQWRGTSSCSNIEERRLSYD